MTRFRPKRLPLADHALDARLRAMEDWLSALGSPPQNMAVSQFGARAGSNAAAAAGQTGGGGGGGGTTILGGDVTGAPVTNTVSALQATTLTITSPLTGNLLSWNGSAWVNTATVAGPLTVTGTLTAQGNLAHTGGAAGFFGATPAAQIAGSTDVLAGLVTLGLRAASSNPPLNLGTGGVTAGTSTFTAPAAGRCLTLNADTGATIFVQPKAGTNFSNYKVNNSLQLITDLAQTGSFTVQFENLHTGAVWLQNDGADNISLGVSGAKMGFFGAAVAAQPAGSSDVLAGLVTLGLRAASSNPPLNLGTGGVTAGTSTFTAPAAGRCLTLNADTGATIFVQPKAGTNYSNYKVNNVLQLITDIAQTGSFTVQFQNLHTGVFWLQNDGADNISVGVSGAQMGFFGAAVAAQPAGSSDVLAGLVTLGLRAASSNPPLNLGTGAITAGTSTFSGTNANPVTVAVTGSGALSLTQANTTKRVVTNLNGVMQYGTDLANNGTADFWFQNLGTGNNIITISATDLITLGSTAAAGGVTVGVSGGKIGFLGAATVAQQANASQAGINAVTDANAKAALQAIYNLLHTYGLAPATA